METIIVIVAIVAILGFAAFKIVQMYKNRTPKGTMHKGGGGGGNINSKE